MASFNPYDAINRIYNLKGEWQAATEAGDTERAQKAAQAAQQYYEQLRKYNYGDIADELANKNYEQAKFVKDYYGKLGGTEFRPYMYSLGNKYGLSQADVDKLIRWDDTTDEITFGGKKLGKPYSVVDGSSYFQDTSILDEAFEDYIQRSGLARPASTMVSQENESLFKKYSDEYDYLKSTNPFETEIGKSILERYDLQGLQGRDNEVASGAATNAGNIDSFAAANALRQQAALRSLGEQTALAAHQQRLDNARNLLAQIGVHIDRVFNQDQTALNNQVSRDLAVAQTFGKATSNQLTNPYIGKDMDFMAAYNAAKAAGASSEVLNQIAEARFMKQVGMNDFGAGVIPFTPTSKETAEMILTNKQLDSAERIASGEQKNAIEKIKAQAQTEKELLEAQAKNAPVLTREQALKEVQALGYVATEEQARTLNLPVGTRINPKDATAGAANNEEDVKTIIYTVPEGSNEVYYPIQQLLNDRLNFERATSKEFVDQLIVEEAAKVARAEGYKLNKKSIGEVLKKIGFSDYKTLQELYDG